MKKITLILLASLTWWSTVAQQKTEQLGIEVKPVTIEFAVTPGSSAVIKICF